MPAGVPPPEDLPTLAERCVDHPELRELVEGPQPIEQRYVDPPAWERTEPSDRPQRVWIRANGTLPDDPLLHVCMLTYASDMMLLNTVLVRHGLSPVRHKLAMASLDHAMWFLHPFRMDEWILYSIKSPAASGGRGLATGRFFSAAGRHLGSVAQEGMVRVIKP